MAWPRLRNKSSASLMTESNRSGAAHDGARSQEKAPEEAPGGQVRLPFLRAQGARRTEGTGGTAGRGGTGRAGGAEGTGGTAGRGGTGRAGEAGGTGGPETVR